MSFVEREMRFSFSGAASGSFSAEGLRAVASLQAYPGRGGTLAQVKIWGLSLPQMNAYSSTIPAAVSVEKFNLVIEAGDVGGTLSQVINGPILRSFIDLSDTPESSFNVSVVDVYTAAQTIASQSQPGAQNASDLIASLCAAAGLSLKGSAPGVLRNPSTYGSAIDQIEKIAHAAGINWKHGNNFVEIWPRGGTVDDVVIQVGPDTEPCMVGYPVWWEAGIIVRSIFNQQVQIGRQMQVTSSIPKANGTWQISQVEHDLSTMFDGGPWFTTAKLALLGSPAATGDDDDDDD